MVSCPFFGVVTLVMSAKMCILLEMIEEMWMKRR